MKTCTKCGESKPPSEFSREAAQKSGLRPDCKACRSRYQSAYRDKDDVREKKRDYMRHYRAENPEVVKRANETGRQWHAAHPDLRREGVRRFREARPDRAKQIALRYHYRKNYGLTMEERDAIYCAQASGCLICGCPAPAPNALHVDHDHTTNAVRGLLCNGCNCGIGFFKDDPQRMLRAVDYLLQQPHIAGAFLKQPPEQNTGGK